MGVPAAQQAAAQGFSRSFDDYVLVACADAPLGTSLPSLPAAAGAAAVSALFALHLLLSARSDDPSQGTLTAHFRRGC